MIRFAAISLALFVFCVSQSAVADDWPGLRGSDGRANVYNDYELFPKEFKLKVGWKAPIGSGYSSICISRGRVVTMYADGETDVIGCFDGRTGELAWKTPIGPRHKGSDGSFDGPISTSFVHDGMVFGLNGSGRLLAVDLETGDNRWEKKLTDEWEAPAPPYGFSTSPLVVAGTLIVQVGAKEASIIGLDPRTGDQRWAVGDDQVAFQSPIPFLINGTEYVLAAGNAKFAAINPESGSLLFNVDHQGMGVRGAMSMVPVPVGPAQVFLAHSDHQSKLVTINNDNGELSVVEDWSAPTIRNSFAVPVAHDGFLYGYNNRFLTCVDAQDGAAKWRSRQPGDGFVMIVDDHLVTITKAGSLHVARATPDKYDEVCSLKIFDDLVWSLPSFSNGSFFVRSMGELARVDVVSDTGVAEDVAEAELPLGKLFRTVVESARQGNDGPGDGTTRISLTQFLQGAPDSPFIEDGIAHFWYYGQAQDVAVGCDVFGSRQERTMHRVGDSDFLYYSIKLPPTQRANYVYYVDYKPSLDPNNAKKFTSSVYVNQMEFGMGLPGEIPLQMNWFGMSDWKMKEFVEKILNKDSPSQSPEARGELTKLDFNSEILKKEIRIEVYTPPGYDADPDRRFPVIYVHDGAKARMVGGLTIAADHLMQSDQISPAIIVFIHMAINPMEQPTGYEDAIGKELVSKIDAEYRTIADRKSRSNYATGFGSSFAFMTAAAHPDKFSRLATQSPLLFGPERDMVLDAFGNLEQPTRIYFEWGNYDLFNPHENWDMRETNQELYDELSKFEHVKLYGGQVTDTTDWPSWRNRFDDILSVLILPD